MREDETFEYEGVTVTIKLAWAGYTYEFDYLGTHYFAHYPFSYFAKWGAEDRIRKLKLYEEERNELHYQ